MGEKIKKETERLEAQIEDDSQQALSDDEKSNFSRLSSGDRWTKVKGMFMFVCSYDCVLCLLS